MEALFSGMYNNSSNLRLEEINDSVSLIRCACESWEK